MRNPLSVGDEEMVPSAAGSRRVTEAMPGMRRDSFLVLLLVGLYLLAGLVTALAGSQGGFVTAASPGLSEPLSAVAPARAAAHPLYLFPPGAGPTPAVTSGSNTYYVGAQAPTTACNPTCTYLTNSGARTTIQVVSQTVVGCLSYWIGDDSGANLWGQVGYYICNGATLVAFYQVWNLSSGAALTTGTTTVSAGYHTFSMYSQSGGTVWAFALDGTVFGTYDLGSSVSLGTYPVQAVSEEGLVSGPWIPAQVNFTSAIQTLQTASTNPAGSGWISPASAFEPWGGCASDGTPNNSGGYTCWGIAGNLQDSTIPLDALVVGGNRALLRSGTNLWSGTAPDFSLSASPTGMTVSAGATGTSTVTVSGVNGFTGTVALAATVSPATGLTCSLSPSSVTGSGTSTLSCTGSTAGAYTVTVTGTSGSLSRSTTVTYNVSGGIALTLSFFLVGGGTGYTAPTFTYVQGGATKTATLTTSATAYAVDANSGWSVTNPLAGSSGSERWQTSQAASGTATASATIAFGYYHQVAVTFAYSVVGGGSGYSAPSVAYTSFGTAGSAATGTSVWADAGTAYDYPASLPGSGSTEAWRTNTLSGTIAASATITVAYYHQFSVTFGYTVLGGGSGYTAPAAATTQFGLSVSIATGTAAWIDAGASYAYTNPLAGSSTTQRWAAPSAGGTVSAAGTVGVSYYHQFLITFSYAVVGGGSGYTPPTVGYASLGASSSTATGIAVWADSGSAYAFTNPLQGSTSTEAWKTPTATGSVTQSGTLATSYYHQVLATFAFQVLGGGSGYSAPSVAYTSLGTVASTATGLGVWADVGSSYRFQSPLPGSTSSESWPTPASSGTVTTSGTITASYYHQFSVTFGYTVQGGGSGYAAPSVTVAQFGATTTVAVGVATWVDASTTYTSTNPLGGSTGSERWIAAVATGTVAAAGTVSLTYVHQVSVTFAYVVQGGGSGYSAPSVTYSSLGATASTVTGSPVWADASTAYAFASALPGSTSTAAWRTGAGTATVTAAGTLTATYYYQFLVNFLVQVVNGPAPPTMPTLTATEFGATTSLTAGGSSWVDANGSYSYPASFAGAPGEQWMSGSPSSGTVTLPGTLTASYYHEYSVTFAYAVSGGGIGYGAPSVAYVALGTSLTTAAGTTAWTDAGSAFAYTSALTGGASTERWMTGAPGGTVTGTGTFTVTYVHQFWVDFSYVVKGGGTGYSAPNVTFSNLSATVNVAATSLWVWANAGGSYSYQNPLPGSTSTNSWQTNNGLGSVGSSTTYSATYRHQFKVKFKATTTSGTVTPETPLVNVTVFGLNVSLPADNVTWVDAGSDYGFPSVFYGPLPGERWITATPPSGVILGPMNITAAYQHQYYLAIQVNAPAGGSVSGSPGWYNETMSLQLKATAAPGWQFQGWIGSGNGSYTGASATASVSMDAPVTETAVFYVGLTLSASSGGSLQYTYGGTSGWVPAGTSQTLYLSPGTEVTVKATPTWFYQMNGWSGAASGSPSTVVVVANAPESLNAAFGLSLYSKVDSLLGIASVLTILFAILGVRRHRRKKKALRLRAARMRAPARGQSIR